MNSRVVRTRSIPPLVGLGSILVVLLSNPAVSSAQPCPTPSALVSGVPVPTGVDPSHYEVTPASNRWSAVAVRGTDINDWNVDAWDTTAPPPACLAGMLAGSGTASLDFVVTDWRFRAPGTDLVRAATGGGIGSEAVVEFEQADSELQPNMPFQVRTLTSDDLVTVFECTMLAGVPYIIQLAGSAGLTGLNSFIFAPVSGGSGWLGRDDRVVEVGLAEGLNGIPFTPTVDGVHAIVVVNESGGNGDLYSMVGRCPFFSSILSDNVPFFLPALEDWPAFTPSADAWSVVGARGNPGYRYIVDIAPFPRSQTGIQSLCSDSILASQYSGHGIKLVAGDFRTLPVRMYTARVALEGDLKTSSAGFVEWENGADSIVVNAGPLLVSPPANNVLDAWSVRLAAGSSYDIEIVPAGGATATYELVLFKNTGGAWASRPDAVFTTTGAGNYLPTETDRFSLVVLNDNGGTGDYTVSITSSQVDVPGPGPLGVTSRIRSAAPNPAIAGARVDFELATAGRATLAIRDAQGRTVATVPLGVRPAGIGTAAWNGKNGDGRRVASGVYFLSLVLDGRATEGTKLIVLE